MSMRRSHEVNRPSGPTGSGRLFYAPMRTLYLLDPLTGRPEHVAPVNVSQGCPRCFVRRTCGRLEPDDQEHDWAHLSTNVEGINRSIAQCDSTFLPTVLATSLVRCLPGR
jgi:hypothetical protein